MLAVLFAVCAAVANAGSSVLQREAARRTSDARAFSAGLLWDLARRPVWYGGIAAGGAAFGLQALALANGPVSLVQPILAMELPFTVLLAWPALHERPHRNEWMAVIAMAVGLAVLLFSLSPGSGTNPDTVGLAAWLGGVAVTLAVVATLTVLGHRHPGPLRAMFVAAAAGTGFALTAVLVKAVTSAYEHGGIVAIFTSWQTYLVVVVSTGSFYLLQNAMQAGRLVAAQPALTLSDPVVAVIWGIVVFHEQVRDGLWLIPTFAGVALLAAGVFLLARSPLLLEEAAHGQPPSSRVGEAVDSALRLNRNEGRG